MSEEPNRPAEKTLGVKIPKALIERVESYCQSIGIAPHEFIIDAISEKLASIHKEKRRKPRL